jgi:hypothetical protein
MMVSSVWIVIAVTALSLSACSSQPAIGASPGAAQGASANAGQKCEIDAKRVCQEMKDRPVVDSQTGELHDRTEREQNQARTASETFWYQIPNGSMIEVACEINTEHSSVVYAHLLPGARLTPTDVAALQNSGYCAH